LRLKTSRIKKSGWWNFINTIVKISWQRSPTGSFY
jgi:hypothetical protein